MLSSVVQYFDLQSTRRSFVEESQVGKDESAPVFPQYLTVSAGVVIEPLLRNYITIGEWNIDWHVFGGRVIFGLIVGLILLPAVYKATFDPKKPIFVQLAAMFPLGIGWQSLFTSATKIALG